MNKNMPIIPSITPWIPFINRRLAEQPAGQPIAAQIAEEDPIIVWIALALLVSAILFFVIAFIVILCQDWIRNKKQKQNK